MSAVLHVAFWFIVGDLTLLGAIVALIAACNWWDARRPAWQSRNGLTVVPAPTLRDDTVIQAWLVTREDGDLNDEWARMNGGAS